MFINVLQNTEYRRDYNATYANVKIQLCNNKVLNSKLSFLGSTLRLSKDKKQQSRELKG